MNGKYHAVVSGPNQMTITAPWPDWKPVTVKLFTTTEPMLPEDIEMPAYEQIVFGDKPCAVGWYDSKVLWPYLDVRIAPIMAVRKLVEWIAERLIPETWLPPSKRNVSSAVRQAIRTTKRKQVEKRIAPSVAHCAKQLYMEHPDLQWRYDLAKRLYAASNYNGDELAFGNELVFGCDPINHGSYLHRDIMQCYGVAWLVSHIYHHNAHDDEAMQCLVEGDWQKAMISLSYWSRYGNDHQIKGPLRRMLAKWPGGMPHYVFAALLLRQPLRALTSTRQILMYGALCHQYGGAWAYFTKPTRDHKWECGYKIDSKHEDVLRIVENATDDDIKKAWSIMGEFGQKEPLRKPKQYTEMATYLRDGNVSAVPIGPNDSLPTLMRRANEHHKQLHIQVMQQQEELLREANLDMGTPVAVPPISLPKVAGITFLDSIGAIKAEGVLMGHCVAQYANRAMHGQCYLFHTEHDGETATTEVDSSGIVNQSYGPRNRTNKASAYASKKLDVWGRKMRKAASESQLYADVDTDPVLDEADLPF